MIIRPSFPAVAGPKIKYNIVSLYVSEQSISQFTRALSNRKAVNVPVKVLTTSWSLSLDL